MATKPKPRSSKTLPPDNHVHTQFSWDAPDGSMIDACEQAAKLGLPSVAFTEHIDLTPWIIPSAAIPAFGSFATHVHDGVFSAPEVDFDGYFASIAECRSRFPDLGIVTGLEIGEPHWFPEITTKLLTGGRFDRVLGSLHSLQIDSKPRLIDEWFQSEAVTGSTEQWAVEQYLEESIRLIEQDDHFQVFAHIDYLTRQINKAGRIHNPTEFEDQYRATLRTLAKSGRVLEINTRVPLDPLIVRWWYDEGGGGVSFGSDAHNGHSVGAGFELAAAMAAGIGFKPQADRHDFWRR